MSRLGTSWFCFHSISARPRTILIAAPGARAGGPAVPRLPPGWTQPGAGSTGLYPSPRLLRVCPDSPRGCPSPPTLISLSRVGKEEPPPLGALAALSSPLGQMGVWPGLFLTLDHDGAVTGMARLQSEPLWGFGSIKS